MDESCKYAGMQVRRDAGMQGCRLPHSKEMSQNDSRVREIDKFQNAPGLDSFKGTGRADMHDGSSLSQR